MAGQPDYLDVDYHPTRAKYSLILIQFFIRFDSIQKFVYL